MEFFRSQKYKRGQKHLLSGRAEQEFIDESLWANLSKIPRSFLLEDYINTNPLFVDWLSKHTKLNSSTTLKEHFLLLVPILQKNLSDKTGLKLTLEAKISKEIFSLSFADLTFLLHLYSNAKLQRPFPACVLSTTIKALLPAPHHPHNNPQASRQHRLPANTRRHTSNAIYHIAHMHSGVAMRCRLCVSVYDLLYDMADSLFGDGLCGDGPNVSVKSLVECAFSMLFDSDLDFLDDVDRILEVVFENLESLQVNDVLIMAK